MIKVLDSSFNRLGVIKNAISASRLEEINGENILDFEAVLDSKMNSFIGDNTIFELNNDYFDIAFYKKTVNEDNTHTVEVQSEHVSYRLNREEYNKEYFTETGTPTYILGKILEGTGFTIGTLEFSTNLTYSLQEASSRRQLLMEFVATLEGEVIFDKFVVSIVAHRGSTEPKPALKDRNVKIVAKSFNKHTLDDAGNPKVSYVCQPIYLPGDTYELGDDILLFQNVLGIQETLRVVRISYDPYNLLKSAFEFANYTNGLEDSLYRITTQAVVKDALYNGIRIGPEYGFEAVRNDKLARAYFKSDGMVFQSGDGTGTNWVDRLYYEYDSELDETVLMFDGKLTASAIEAITADIDVVVNQTIITENLYATMGTIAELTVDSLETSSKVQRYKDSNPNRIDFIRIEGKNIDFVEGTTYQTFTPEGYQTWSGYPNSPELSSEYWYQTIATDGVTPMLILSDGPMHATAPYVSTTGTKFAIYILTGGAWVLSNEDEGTIIADAGNIVRANSDVFTSAALETVRFEADTTPAGTTDISFDQLTNRDGQPLYWVDETMTQMYTTETDFPVYVYLYNEVYKLRIFYELDSDTGYYNPKMDWGTGAGVDGHPERGKGFVEKDADGFKLSYINEAGVEYSITLGETGILFGGYQSLSDLDFYSNGFKATYGGYVLGYRWTKDGDGKITQLEDIYTEDVVNVTWGSGTL